MSETIFNIIYNFFTTFFIPEGELAPYQNDIIVYFVMVVTIFIFWLALVRPFWLWIKYKMFGSFWGSKSRSGSGRHRVNDDED